MVLEDVSISDFTELREARSVKNILPPHKREDHEIRSVESPPLCGHSIIDTGRIASALASAHCHRRG